MDGDSGRQIFFRRRVYKAARKSPYGEEVPDNDGLTERQDTADEG